MVLESFDKGDDEDGLGYEAYREPVAGVNRRQTS